MYRLLLVDDEEDVREGVIQEIDWEKIGYEVVGKAENGKEALELVEKLVPDVVVTDIKMPFMDGLQLSEAIRTQFSTIKIIILTGFDEFEYAQKAVKLNINEYVLKPFSSQELIDSLMKVKAQIDAEVAEKENIELLRDHYRKSLPVLREVFLTSLISRKLTREEIIEKSRNYGLRVVGKGYAVAVISIDYPASENDVERSGDSQAILTEYEPDQKEIDLFAVKHIADEFFTKHDHGITFIHNDHIVLLTVSEASDRQSVMNSTLPILEEIRHASEKYFKHTITIGLGTHRTQVTNIIYSYEDAVLALDYRWILGNNRVICIDDVEERCGEKVRFDELKEHALIRCIKVGTIAELNDLVEDLFKGFADSNVSIKDYQIYVLEMVTTILKAAKSLHLDIDQVFGKNFMLFDQIQRFNNLAEVKAWIVMICTRIMNSIVAGRQNAYQKLVNQAIDYTKQHFHESDISINKVCHLLHISSGYFSSIFKKETKTTFVNFLMQIRMEAAKEYLLTTDFKAFEIAEKVGFTDANYFSFCFRKHVGVSPKEFRSSAREG